MSDLLAARAQMALSLGFHMIFAAIGIGMPFLMLLAEGMWLRRRDPDYLALAKKWGKVTAVLFAIGAVSGTALSFELGLLWPRFMDFAGAIIGPAFALEGYAFFIEAIFVGLYLYGWDRLSPRAHFLTGIPVAISGAASGILVLSANSWMQKPTGFRIVDGRPVDIDPVAALFNPGWAVFATHSTLSTYVATSFAVAGVYGFALFKGYGTAYNLKAVKLAMIVGTVTAVLQPVSGDLNAQFTTQNQPSKLAAMEGLFQTERGAPLSIGGWPDMRERRLEYALRIPKGLSLLAYRDPNAEVKGLDQIPRNDWPNVPVVHTAFQVMVGLGFTLIGISLWYWASRRWKRLWGRPLFLVLTASGFMGFTALEAGWIVTEVGRQPWIIYGVMRTSEAVTPAPNVLPTFLTFVGLYLFLALALIWLLLRLQTRPGPEESSVGESQHVPA